MKYMSTWTVLPGALKEAVGRFLEGQGEPAEGVKLVGRWHKADCSGGFALFETTNPVALFKSAAVWADCWKSTNPRSSKTATPAPFLRRSSRNNANLFHGGQQSWPIGLRWLIPPCEEGRPASGCEFRCNPARDSDLKPATVPI